MSDEPHVEHENEERWVVTYADMITLLLAFFIMMYASSVVNQEKFEKIVRSTQAQFGIQAIAAPIASAPGSSASSGPGILMGELARALESALGPDIWHSVQLLYGPDSVIVRLTTDELFFAAGQAELEPRLRLVLAQVARVLRRQSGLVRIEGHTCDLPVRSGYTSNWELSAQRAINVLSYFTHYQGIAPERLSASGYADSRPVVPNTSEQARRRNRRVDIVLLDVSAPKLSGDATLRAPEIGMVAPAPPQLAVPVDLRSHEPHGPRQGLSGEANSVLAEQGHVGAGRRPTARDGTTFHKLRAERPLEPTQVAGDRR